MGGQQHVLERRPLQLPRARRPLVLVGRVGNKGRGAVEGAPSRHPDTDGSGGVVLVRQRRRPTASVDRPLAHLAHLRLGEQDHVEADLLARRRAGGHRCGDVDDHVAPGVPWHGRAAHAEQVGEGVGNCQRFRAERGQRPDRAPSWAVSRSSRTAAIRPPTSCNSTAQPAALSPNVVGDACWSRVRPATTVSRGARRESDAAAPAASARAPSSKPRASRSESTTALSTTS